MVEISVIMYLKIWIMTGVILGIFCVHVVPNLTGHTARALQAVKTILK